MFLSKHFDRIRITSILFYILLVSCTHFRMVLASSLRFTITAYNLDNETINDIQTTEYFAKRQAFLNEERDLILGSDVVLEGNELKINELFKNLKLLDLERGLKNPFEFAPARHFFDAIDKINESKLFRLISLMPKGAVLHAHDTALLSGKQLLEILYNPQYKDILWFCYKKIDTKTVTSKFLFSRDKPDNIDDFTEWTLLSVARSNCSDTKTFDKSIRNQFSLYTEDPTKTYKDINEVWKRFINIFMTLDPIVKYVPVWKEYFMLALTEFYGDGVQYLEFRGLLPELYDLDGKIYTQLDTFKIYKEVLDNFKAINPEFIGAKFIYGPNRKVDNATFDEYLETVRNLKKEIPSFLAGFDLVSQEDGGNPLKAYISQFLQLQSTDPEIKFFFHAGETNWNGMETDENLIDAVLLDTKRIGHGFAILKHPNVMRMLKENDIAIEINPISNQVLKLVEDNRNHPATHLFADGYPLVVSSDDPAFWEATPLSHDFYIAFMGIASAQSDLRLLKKLAMNSIKYSAMTDDEKKVAYEKWNKAWGNYINFIASQLA